MSNLRNELIFSEAADQVRAILDALDRDAVDEVSDRIEQIVAIPDLALGCFLYLIMALKGHDISSVNPIADANSRPSVHDLILPPGVKL